MCNTGMGITPIEERVTPHQVDQYSMQHSSIDQDDESKKLKMQYYLMKQQLESATGEYKRKLSEIARNGND